MIGKTPAYITPEEAEKIRNQVYPCGWGDPNVLIIDGTIEIKPHSPDHVCCPCGGLEKETIS